MGLGLKIALFVGIPAAVIVGAGFLLNKFQPVIRESAGAIGETFGNIVSAPVQGFFGQVEDALADLPDTNIRIPGINLSGGLFSFKQEQPIEDVSGQVAPSPGLGDVEFGPETTFDPNTGIIEGSPPTFDAGDIIPKAEASEPTPFNVGRSFNVLGQLLTRERILDLFPRAVGLFDLPQTPNLEFTPLTIEGIQTFQEAGTDVRLSGQLFSEFSNTKSILEGA